VSPPFASAIWPMPRFQRKLNAAFNGTFTSTGWRFRKFLYVMRCAFVLQLGPETDPEQKQFNGWIEEVDTGRELRFRSTDELLVFLSDRARAARMRPAVTNGREDEEQE
jgi:hypothetical protein